MSADPASIDFVVMTMGLLGGLALFLHGMELMSESLKAVAAGRMRQLLGTVTGNRFLAAMTGAGVTAIIQSSSVTTVLSVGFVSAGVMTLAQAIGVIMGADIGTTITAQIIAFKVTKYALGMIALGFLGGHDQKTRAYSSLRHDDHGSGRVLRHGDDVRLHEPLRSYDPFINLMQSMSNPLLGILLGAAFTALVQSSSATLGVIIALGSQGLISLDAGTALVMGANIGTCVTAMLAAIGKPKEAVRAALAHVVIKVIMVGLWLPFMGQLEAIAMWMSPVSDPSLTGADRLAAEIPRQVANVHTALNVVGISILIWFTGPIG